MTLAFALNEGKYGKRSEIVEKSPNYTLKKCNNRKISSYSVEKIN